MDLPYSFVDSIAKMIPNELNMTIDKALSMNAELRKLYESFNSPSSSSVVIVNCVVIEPSDPRESGTK